MKLCDDSKLLFAKVKPNAVIPSKRDCDAGYDVYACFDDDYIVIDSMHVSKIPTGIASVLPNKYCMLLHERSSVGSKNVQLKCGCIDASYRGEWHVVLTNLNAEPFIIAKSYVSDKQLTEKTGYKKFTRYPYERAITQALLIEVPIVEIEIISKDQLNSYVSERGCGGFGSTNKQ